jgi:hypothetical protein
MTIVALDIAASPKSRAEILLNAKDRYGDSTWRDIVKERWGWLLFFFGGLTIAAVIVEAFEMVLKDHVEASHIPSRLPHRPPPVLQLSLTCSPSFCSSATLYRC